MPPAPAHQATPVAAEPAPSRRDRAVQPAGAVEVAGLLVAAALAVLAVWHVAATPRAWMLFYDGDSVLPALVRASIAAGEPQHWSLSAVLFLPEGALAAALASLGMGLKAAFAVNAVLNFLLLYVAFRVTAALAAKEVGRTRQVVGALVATGAFVCLSLLDTSSAWDSAELPSLLATTTYYSATLLALVLAAGLVVAVVRGARLGPRLWLTGLSALSTLSNPLYIGWISGPAAIACLVLAGRQVISWRAWSRVVAAFAVGGGLGLLGRIPFAFLIARDTAGYLAPSQAAHVLFGFYLRILLERLATPLGAVSVVAALALLVLAISLLVRGIRRRDVPLAVLAGIGCASPIVTTVFAIALGTHAFRYLQPVYVAPLLPLVLVGRSDLRPLLRTPASVSGQAFRAALAMIGAIAVVIGGVGVAGLARATDQQDPSIRCLDTWVTNSGRTGAGRFLTIRGPKAYLPHPEQLVQVDSQFRELDWLVNRNDYAQRTVSFVVTDTAVGAPRIPEVGAAPVVVHCGRYTILDFGKPVLRIGAPIPDATP